MVLILQVVSVLCLTAAVGFAVWALLVRSQRDRLDGLCRSTNERLVATERALAEAQAHLQRFAPILDLEAQRRQLAEALAWEQQQAAITRQQLAEQATSQQRQVHDEAEAQRRQLAEALAWEQQQAAIARQQLAEQAASQQRQAHDAIAGLVRTRSELEQGIAGLQAELVSLDEEAMFNEHGLYQHVYDFVSSDKYRARLEKVRERQKATVKAGQAAICAIQWTVEGSAAKGKKMIGDTLKLMLRAFNGECDAAIAKVKYNNIHAMINRVEKSFAKINAMAAVNKCEITQAYLHAKLDELRLTHEYQEKCEAEREEQRRIKEQMREEAKVAKEIEKAQRDAEREEAKLAALLEQAQAQAQATVGARHERLLGKIEELQRQLAVAVEQKQRARARAEFTRAGHVYVISNIGAFGHGVYKIGMTRRLEPNDRVRELGDASVPFRFDVHAMIATEDAPGLESRLHTIFHHRRVNLVNTRKEFFAVALEEIEVAVSEHHGVFEFIKEPEAEEYRQTQAMRQQAAHAAVAASASPA